MTLTRRTVLGGALAGSIGIILGSEEASAAGAATLGTLTMSGRYLTSRSCPIMGAATVGETRRALGRGAVVTPPGSGPLELDGDVLIVGERVVARGPLRWLDRLGLNDSMVVTPKSSPAVEYRVVRSMVVPRQTQPQQGYLWQPADPGVVHWNTSGTSSLTVLSQTRPDRRPTGNKHLLLVGLLRSS